VVLRREREDRLLRRLAEEEALTRSGIDESAIQEWYDRNPEPELLVRHFVVLSERRDSSEDRSSAASRALQGLERIRNGESFPSVAGKVSEETGAEARGGLLEPGREGSWVGEFWMAANSLEEGEVSEVVETQYGFHVLRLEKRRAVPFAEARTGAVSRLVSELALLPPFDPSGVPLEVEENERELRLSEVSRRGLVLTPDEEAEVMNPWLARVEKWAEIFGFQERMMSEEIAARAIVAVGLSSQEAMIARSELSEWAETLASAYPLASTHFPSTVGP
jgi:hypothetical protein